MCRIRRGFGCRRSYPMKITVSRLTAIVLLPPRAAMPNPSRQTRHFLPHRHHPEITAVHLAPRETHTSIRMLHRRKAGLLIRRLLLLRLPRRLPLYHRIPHTTSSNNSKHNALRTHIALSIGIPLPRRITNSLRRRRRSSSNSRTLGSTHGSIAMTPVLGRQVNRSHTGTTARRRRR